MPQYTEAEMQDKTASSISQLAEHLLVGGDLDLFRERAKEEFDSLDLADPALLEPFFHRPPPESSLYDTATHGFGAWLSCCQFAAFELIYNFGEGGLPFLREIAWGEYDWPQGNAIELLIRLAADGIATESIIAEIKSEFPNIRHEASLYAIEPLIPRLDSDPNLKRVFDRLLSIAYFKDAYDELTYVDPDPYNILDDRMHATVTTVRRDDPGGFPKPILATLEVQGLADFRFKETRGAGGICIAEDCILVKPTENGTTPVSLDDVLKARRIAIGHFPMWFAEDRRVWVCPASIALIDGEKL